MKSEKEKGAFNQVAPAMGKGCLLGIGIGVLFFVVGAVVYLIAGLFPLPERIVLLLAIAGGPIIGTAITMIVLYQRVRRTTPPLQEGEADETAPRD